MKAAQYGLTKAGFIAKPLSVILDEERAAFKQAFGDDVDVGGESVAGAYIGNIAAKLHALWGQLEGVYLAGDRDSASGVYLDRLAALVAVTRQGAKPTRVTAALWGTEGARAAAGTLARLTTTKDEFATSTDIVLDRKSAIGVQLKLGSVNEGDALTLTADTMTAAIAVEAGEQGKDALKRLVDVAKIAFGSDYHFKELDDTTFIVRSLDGVTTHSYDWSAVFGEVLIGGKADFVARKAGRVYCPSMMLTEMVTNVSGIKSVTNYATGVTGRGVESDTELRVNMLRRQRQGTGTEASIENAVSGVAGVMYCKVYSNRSMTAIGDRPPKSFETVVTGGDDEAIAQAIFKSGPAGVEPYGRTQVEVIDSRGTKWQIGFSRPQSVYIHIRVRLTLNDEEVFPDTGRDTVRDSIVKWADAHLGVGVDLMTQRLLVAVFETQGIAQADIDVCSSLDPVWKPQEGDWMHGNITVGEVQSGIVETERVNVGVTGDTD